MKILRKALGAAAEAVDGARQVVVTCSTDAIDRVGDIVVQAGINVANFARLKTVLWNHDQDRPIAKAIEVAIVEGQLRAIVEFPPEGISPKADEIYGLVKAGVINAVSIGFLPLTREPVDGKNLKNGARVTESELLELSFVSVPANPNAEIMERSMRVETKGARRLVVKSLYDLSSLVYALQLLGGVTQDAAWEADYEQDGSEVPGRLAEACREIGAILVDMTAEEVSEYLVRVAPEAGDTEEKRLPHMVVKAALAAPDAPALIAKAGRMLSAKNTSTLADACKAILDGHDAIKGLLDAGTAEDGDAEGEAQKGAPEPETKNLDQERRRRRLRALAAA